MHKLLLSILTALVISLTSAQPPNNGGGRPPNGGGGSRAEEYDYDLIEECSESKYSIVCDDYLLNDEKRVGPIFVDYAPNVHELQIVTYKDMPYLAVKATGLANYTVEATQELIDALNARPLASRDFQGGATSIVAGQTIFFGTDIGYDSNDQCVQNEGHGFWPPGPVCPFDTEKEHYFPLYPVPADQGEECETGLGAIGTLINGVSWYNVEDGTSYNDEGVWFNVAAKFEIFDLDICNGHAANGDYHHHDPPFCLASQIGDDGTNGHSALYGRIADGYPIYGIYQDTSLEAKSCWKVRDYDDPDDPYGCGGTGERTCLMVDPYDPSRGTSETMSPGPNTNEIITSLSSNTFIGVPGLYAQDYYFDSECAAQGNEYLDEFNGHDHGDGIYHYHFTPDYPYGVGPKFKGKIHSNGIYLRCDSLITDGAESIDLSELPDPSLGGVASSPALTASSSSSTNKKSNLPGSKRLYLLIILFLALSLCLVTSFLCCIILFGMPWFLDRDSKPTSTGPTRRSFAAFMPVGTKGDKIHDQEQKNLAAGGPRRTELTPV